MTTLYYESELYHHGIKGQKWGVRRFRNKDGSLTPAGKKRYSDGFDKVADATKKVTSEQVSKVKTKIDTKSSNRRARLEKGYREKGLTAEEAKAAVDRRIKVEKTIAVAGALTLTAAAAYYAKNKYMATYCDTILKSGTTFHNLDAMANERPGEHLYVNYRKNDTDYFRGKFALGKMSRSETGNAFNHMIIAKDDIKIPSINTRKNVFKELYDNDEEFRKVFSRHAGTTIGGKEASAKRVYKNMWQKFGDKDDPEFNVAKRKYFEALRQKGYEAIVDEWDSSPLVFRSDAPLILLNTSSKSLGDMTIQELSTMDVLKAQANSRKYEPIRNLKTAIGVPHTNHFGESDKYLSRYAKKAAKNSEYVEKAMSAKMPEIEKSAKWFADMKMRYGDTDWDKHYNEELKRHIDVMAFKKKGSDLADVGKLLTKHENMTLKEAEKLVEVKNTAKTATALISGLTGYSAVMSVPQTMKRNAYVENYIAEHPNTKKTNKEIEKMWWREQGYNVK